MKLLQDRDADVNSCGLGVEATYVDDLGVLNGVVRRWGDVRCKLEERGFYIARSFRVVRD